MEISSRTHMDHCSTKHICSNSACQIFTDKWLYLRTRQINNDTGKWQNTIIYVNQLNVYILPGLSKSHRRIKISSQTYMDLCSTKHTCSNSACQMFADKWVVLTNTKKYKEIISNKQRYRQMSDYFNEFWFP